MRGQRGQTTVEYLGFFAVVMVVIAVLATQSPGIHRLLQCKLDVPIDRILTEDRQIGECGAPSAPGAPAASSAARRQRITDAIDRAAVERRLR